MTLFLLRMRPAVAASALLLAAVVAIAIIGPALAPYNPYEIQHLKVNQPSSPQHWLGTDEFGRDLLSRLLIGIRPTVMVAMGATVIAAAFGTFLGIVGAYGPRLVSFGIMRSVDILLAFPPILLALLAVGFWQSGVVSLMAVIGVVYTPHFARIAQSSTLQVMQQEYVQAERSMGASPLRIVFRAILPNILSPLMVQATLTIAAAILLESGLSFLGLGIVPPEPSWGQMIGTARSYLSINPMYLVWPALCLAMTVLAINIIGDYLRDLLDPRLRQ
ncbi:ABC transporter permease [Arsenicitalea aurantiaca]|uniref:ABC transporter permease n=1 Tax=Arsenicitalea aurantiaca TaxID=1783274 RepID=A0A433X7A4_9HYPH|nr:ABC transporter permease [Arsenicitalea aurantiaca]RUT29939.1 ABC transporter permease [Arsenicitalea aurantiaca]